MGSAGSVEEFAMTTLTISKRVKETELPGDFMSLLIKMVVILGDSPAILPILHPAWVGSRFEAWQQGFLPFRSLDSGVNGMLPLGSLFPKVSHRSGV
jgi:hypothetical protein